MKLISKLSLALIVALLLSACSANVPQQAKENVQSDKVLKIVTTVAPLYSFTRSVVDGTKTKLINIVPTQMKPADFQLNAAIKNELDEADVIIVNGLGLEPFLDTLVGTYQDKIVYASAGIEAFKNTKGESDPYVWLDPLNAIKQVDNITGALSAKDPNNERNFVRNATVFKARLVAINAEIQEKTKSWSADVRSLTGFDPIGRDLDRDGYFVMIRTNLALMQKTLGTAK